MCGSDAASPMSSATYRNAKGPLIVLALNSGSSSLKFGVYRVDAHHTEPLISGEAESIGKQASAFHATDPRGVLLLHESTPLADARQAMIRIKQLLTDSKIPPPQSIGHRIVHGGCQFSFLMSANQTADTIPL